MKDNGYKLWDNSEQIVLERPGGFSNINFRNTDNNHRWRVAGPGQVYSSNGSGVINDSDGLLFAYIADTTEYLNCHFMSSGSLSIRNTLYSSTIISVSDDRLKFNEEIINNGLQTILQLNPTKYDKSLILNVEENTEREAGFIAQEVFKIPELKPYVMEGNEESPWRINYNCIIPYLASVIKEQNKIIEELRVRVEELEKR